MVLNFVANTYKILENIMIRSTLEFNYSRDGSVYYTTTMQRAVRWFSSGHTRVHQDNLMFFLPLKGKMGIGI